MSPYTATVWTDEVLASTPAKYTIVDDSAGSIAASATIELATGVTTPGTALNATNLNHLEQGLVDIEAATIPEILTAKGDLVVASAADTAAILGVGAAGTYLIPNSGEATGLKWTQMFTYGLWTSTNWDGDSKTANTTYTITAASEFGVPAAAKMILVNLSISWASITAWVSNVYIARPGFSTAAEALLALPLRASISAGTYYRVAGWVPLDSNGQFCVRVVQTNVTAVLSVLAYML